VDCVLGSHQEAASMLWATPSGVGIDTSPIKENAACPVADSLSERPRARFALVASAFALLLARPSSPSQGRLRNFTGHSSLPKSTLALQAAGIRSSKINLGGTDRAQGARADRPLSRIHEGMLLGPWPSR
jgi:hypothetical protein